MTVCSQCQRRRAKRRCPALGAELCSLCCGRLRGQDVRCPESCPHLSRHLPYQERKAFQKKAFPAAQIPRDERWSWLVLNIESLLEKIAADRPEFTDREAVLALAAARDKTEKARPALLVSEASARPEGGPGEIIYQGIERCRFEGRIVLPQPLQAYSREEKLAALDDLIAGIRRLAGEEPEGRTYLEELAARFARGRGTAPPGRHIITAR